MLVSDGEHRDSENTHTHTYINIRFCNNTYRFYEILNIYGSLCYTATAAKSLQSCPTLCDPIDGSPPGSPIPGIVQARTLEWVAISFSNAWKWKMKVKSLSRVWLLATPWTAVFQAPLSVGFSRRECWTEVPLPSPLFYTVGPYWLSILYIIVCIC